MDFGLTLTERSAHRLTHFTVDDNPKILKTTVPQALWQICVKGFVRILIGADNQKQYDTYDWEAGCHALRNPDLTYPPVLPYPQLSWSGRGLSLQRSCCHLRRRYRLCLSP
ncbi:hypothetical protein [Acaryochloris sp. 'Moss Beach']|uniref:hypothetical protein n=1 Tax=Acaryochloris sp. 'Moss Beach' TaxID=2740837 RepID=UPI001F48AECF|nr:hypothetical protein [Acaryochloris sp. 'Moss Beach']